MSELVVVGFKDTEEADRVLLRLSKLKREYLIDIDDAVVVVRDETGKVHLKQSIESRRNQRNFRFCSWKFIGHLRRTTIP